MNILWIEDFPPETPDHKALAQNLFSDLINKGNPFIDFISDEDENDGDEDDDFHIKFVRYFYEKAKGIHKLSICRNRDEFINEKYIDNILDYDIFIIDINLSSGSDRISEQSKWDGFGIYNDILRQGIPESNTAIMTGNADDLKKECERLSISFPTQLFFKSINYDIFRVWLGEKAKDPYIQLRRAILDSCEELKKLENKEILLNRIIRKDEKELPWDYGIKFLDRIHQLFIREFWSSRDSNKSNYRLSLYLLGISSEWDKASITCHMFLEDYNDLECNYTRWKREQIEFQKIAVWILKNTRNSLAHSTFKEDIKPTDFAFFYLLAMRNFFLMDPDKIYHYEILLLKIMENYLEDEKIYRTKLEELSKHYEDTIRNDIEFIYEVKAKSNYKSLDEEQNKLCGQDFVQLCLTFFESSKKENNLVTKEEISKYSLSIFYSCFLKQNLFASRKNKDSFLSITHVMSSFACKRIESELNQSTSSDN